MGFFFGFVADYVTLTSCLCLIFSPKLTFVSSVLVPNLSPSLFDFYYDFNSFLDVISPAVLVNHYLTIIVIIGKNKKRFSHILVISSLYLS